MTKKILEFFFPTTLCFGYFIWFCGVRYLVFWEFWEWDIIRCVLLTLEATLLQNIWFIFIESSINRNLLSKLCLRYQLEHFNQNLQVLTIFLFTIFIKFLRFWLFCFYSYVWVLFGRDFIVFLLNIVVLNWCRSRKTVGFHYLIYAVWLLFMSVIVWLVIWLNCNNNNWCLTIIIINIDQFFLMRNLNAHEMWICNLNKFKFK